MKEKDWCRHTSIHTRVNSEYRISSIWREYGNAYFNDWEWETFVWKRENGEENIDFQADTCIDIYDVMKIHKILYDKIINELSYE